jgi:hypothetical protein
MRRKLNRCWRQNHEAGLAGTVDRRRTAGGNRLRGTLADYTMRPDRNPLAQAQAEHVWFSREASQGGRGVGGGGCGCN